MDEIRISKDKLKKVIFGVLIVLIVWAIIATVFDVVLFKLLIKEKEKAEPASVILTDTTSREPEVKKLEVTVEYLNKKLENISELSAAKLFYTGICNIEEGKIPVLTKKGYSMIYEATVTAGIDASKIDIDIQDDVVTITIPKSEIQVIKVDPNSIQFYDEKKALFNWTELGDSVNGIIVAEDDIKEKASTDELLERADTQVEYIVRGLLEDIIKEADGERSLKITRI